MKDAISLVPAFVIHARPYRETSLLLDFFTLSHGRLSAVARGVRNKKSPKKSLLQPFNALVVSMVGKHELKTLTDVECAVADGPLQGDRLLSGLYLNELLYRVLPKDDAHPHLFERYQETVAALREDSQVLESTLRLFERQLLVSLGYGLSLTQSKQGDIISEGVYLFQAGHGFTQVEPCEVDERIPLFRGQDLLAFAENDFSDKMTLKSAKQLMRLAILDLLGGRKINARALFEARGA